MRSAVVLGKGELAVRISEWFREADDYELVGVVPVVPEPNWTESLTAWAERSDVPIAVTGRYDDLPVARDGETRIDLAISVYYDRILRPWFIDRCRRILNIHNSPLPRYRGVSPINWALKNGETRHGVSIHEIVEAVDAGPIVAQLEYSIYPELDEVVDVYRRALEYAWVLFQQTMPLLDRIEARPQDESQATYHSRQEDELLLERRGFTRAESR
jgi:methionyl-tRNA formyltransferase